MNKHINVYHALLCITIIGAGVSFGLMRYSGNMEQPDVVVVPKKTAIVYPVGIDKDLVTPLKNGYFLIEKSKPDLNYITHYYLEKDGKKIIDLESGGFDGSYYLQADFDNYIDMMYRSRSSCSLYSFSLIKKSTGEEIVSAIQLPMVPSDDFEEPAIDYKNNLIVYTLGEDSDTQSLIVHNLVTGKHTIFNLTNEILENSGVWVWSACDGVRLSDFSEQKVTVVYTDVDNKEHTVVLYPVK